MSSVIGSIIVHLAVPIVRKADMNLLVINSNILISKFKKLMFQSQFGLIHWLESIFKYFYK